MRETESGGPARVLAVPGTVPRAAVAAAERALAVDGDPAGTGGGAVTVLVVPAAVPLGSDELELIAAAGVPPSSLVVLSAGRRGASRPRDAVQRQRRVLAEFAPGYEECTFVSAADSAGRLREAVERTRRAAAGVDAAAELDACRAAAERAGAGRARARRREDAERAAGALRAKRNLLVRRRAALRSEDGLPARMTALRTELSRVRVELGHAIAAQSRQASAAARSDLDGAGRAEAEDFPRVLERRLGAAGEGFARLMDERIAAAVPGGAAGGAGPVEEAPRLPDSPGRGRRAVEDRLVILMGASAGLGLGRLVTAGPISGLVGTEPWGALAWPAALALGGLAAWWIVRARTHLARRARLTQWAAEAVAEFRAGWERRLAHRVLDAEAQAARAVGAAHARDLRAVESELARVDARLAALRRGAPGRGPAPPAPPVDDAHAGPEPAVP